MSAVEENIIVDTDAVTKTEVPIGHRIFVGNLAYNVDNEKLKELFGECGTIIDAVAVKRFNRSLGYGFVTFEEEAAAIKSLEKKDTDLEGRPINVELAVPRDESGTRRSNRRTTRGGRRNRPMQSGEPSKITIHIGNLPYEVNESDVKLIFEGYGISKLNLIRRFDGTSRGYGFVTFNSEEEQQAALADFENKDVLFGERKASIHAALSEEHVKKPESDSETA